MIIYPAIDLLAGRAVRLKQGDRNQVTDYGNPLEIALRYKEAGARWLHIVDLDGAFEGRGSVDNLRAIDAICQFLGIPVQLGGGIRSLEDVRNRIERGVTRVILGTIALEQPDQLALAAQRYPGQIAVGIDARDGKVAVRGWVESGEFTPLQLAMRAKEAGVEHVLYTDIARDGMLSGPNIEATARLVRESGLRVMGSGGVSRIEDIRALRDAGADGAIVGKALLDGRIPLQEAISVGGDAI